MGKQDVKQFLDSKIGKLFIEREGTKFVRADQIVLFLSWNYKRIYSGDDGIELCFFSLSENKIIKQVTVIDVMEFEFYFYYTELTDD